jgi:ParB/RepB/Spo0J family partition protein
MAEEKIEIVPIESIVPLPGNTAVIGREEDLMLRADMGRAEKGLYKIDPILLRRLAPEEIEKYKEKYPWAKHQILDGHSRWEAAKELGWHQIRAIIIDATPDEALEINYKKNKARGKVDPLREAMYFKHLYEDLKLDTYKIAEKFSITHQRVSQILKRIKISKEARRNIATRVAMGKEVSGKHLEVIASVPEEKQVELTEAIIEGDLTWKETEKAKETIEKGAPKEEAIRKAKEKPPPKPKKEEWEPFSCQKCGQQYRINWKEHLIEIPID